MLLSASLAVVLVPAIIIFMFKNAYKKPNNFPPGPPSLPIYGAYWIILAHELNNLAYAFVKLGKKYKTKILGFYLASFPAVIINDPQLIKEMLTREVFDGRMDIILGRLRSFWKKLGIFFVDGNYWNIQRRFSLRHMRDYGFGKRDKTLEAVIASEISDMIDMIMYGPKYPAEKELVKGDLIYLPHALDIPFLNGMMAVFTKTTIPREGYHLLWNLAKNGIIFQRSSDDLGRALSLTPWLKDVIPNLSGYNGLVKGNQSFIELFENTINEAMATYDETHDRHFMDKYISKMKRELKETGRSTFSFEQQILLCTDYMFPASTAVQMVLTILIERILYQPEIQDKIHEEIDRVIGKDRMPTLDDRNNMPYLECCIREIMRVETIVPLGIPHRAMEDTTLGGYDIPKGTLVAANYIFLHMDKEIWGDPENFRPERFMENGKLLVCKDKSLPFGAGKRLCAGETYARQTMFQVFAGFMQMFKVSTENGKPLKELSKRIPGIITTIPEFWVRVTPRT